MKVLATFQQERSAVPYYAEQLIASNYQKHENFPSTFVPGEVVEKYNQCCPACQRVVPLEHGTRLLCSCGLIMEQYGNSLTVWK